MQNPARPMITTALTCAALVAVTFFAAPVHGIDAAPARAPQSTPAPSTGSLGPAPSPASLGIHGKELSYDRQREGYVPAPGTVKSGPLVVAASQRQSLAALSTTGGSWSSLGPAPISMPGYPYTAASGRVLALAYAKATGTIYLGAADGGVWKTTNGGTSWTALTDSMPSLAIGALSVDPTNNDVIYAGTGEIAQCIDCLYGIGIYKSTDGGSTWTLYGNTVFQGQAISAVAVDPSNPSDVYAGVVNYGSGGNLGVAVSTDGGQSWSEPAGRGTLAGDNVTDLTIDAHGDLYAAVGGSGSANGVYFSSTHGVSWTKKSSGLPGSSGDQYKIALAPNTAAQSSAAQVLYVAVDDAASSTFGNLLGIYRTVNGASSWTQIATSSAAASSEDQGWYDMYIAVDPSDATGNTVYFGLSDVYKTTEGLTTGPTWTDLTNVYGSNPAAVHPDQHAVLFVNGTTYFGNDGGVYMSTDGGSTFSSANGNLALSQFYAGALGPSGSSLILGGTQDNGTVITQGSGWSEADGGDGFYTAIDPADTSIMYDEYYDASIGKSTDGGNSWSNAITGFPANGDNPNWSAPLVMDPNTPSTLYSGQTHLWKTTDSAGSWTDISAKLAPAAPLSAVAVSKSAPNTIYIGDSAAESWVTTDGGSTWTPMNGSSCVATHPSPYWCTASGSTITGLALDPTNSQTVYASVNSFEPGSGLHVFKSTDGGTTWNDISTTLPDIPFQSVAVNPASPNIIYAGADNGVYTSTDGGTSWSVLGTGLPHVSVYELVPNASGTVLYAFTHGRGVWSIAGAPTAARVSNFTVRRSGSVVAFHWRVASSVGIAGFDLEAGSYPHMHRLNGRVLRVHDAGDSRAHVYRYHARWSGRGPFLLRVLLTGGGHITLSALKRIRQP